MHPFLYFGSHPSDWFEGANMGHLYELRFATAPSAAQRRAIGDNDWEAWTRAQQPTPTAGPAWPGYAPQSWYGQRRDPSLPTGGADAGFSAAVEAGCDAGPPEEPAEPEPVITVDPATPADLEDAVGRAEKFLEQYTSHRDYFDDAECRVWMQYTSPNLGKTAIEVLFCCVSDAEDPELVELCERAIGALHAQLPNLSYGVEWSLDAG
jgi:hypothetical protein